MLEGRFTLEDFLAQLQQVKKLGSLGGILSLLPGVPKEIKQAAQHRRRPGRPGRGDHPVHDPHERADPALIDGSRRSRIATGQRDHHPGGQPAAAPVQRGPAAHARSRDARRDARRRGKGKMAQALSERMGDAADPALGARRPRRRRPFGGPWAGPLGTGRARGEPRSARRRAQGPSGLEEEEGWPGDPQGAAAQEASGARAPSGPGARPVSTPGPRRATIGGPRPSRSEAHDEEGRDQTVAVKLRLMRMGKKKQPTYRVVAADSRSPRDGRFIEIVGHLRAAGPVDGRARRHRRHRQRQGPQVAAPGRHSPPSGSRSSCGPRARGTSSSRLEAARPVSTTWTSTPPGSATWATCEDSTTCRQPVDDMAGNRVEGGTRPRRARLHHPLASPASPTPSWSRPRSRPRRALPHPRRPR